jgi:hypothetical protein
VHTDNVVASSSWLTYLFSMWWWGCCFCGLKTVASCTQQLPLLH